MKLRLRSVVYSIGGCSIAAREGHDETHARCEASTQTEVSRACAVGIVSHVVVSADDCVAATGGGSLKVGVDCGEGGGCGGGGGVGETSTLVSLASHSWAASFK